MKLLIHSNSPHTGTGYAGQLRGLIPRLKTAGHDVAVAANFGVGGASLNWQGTVIYPLYEESQNADVIGYYARHFGADVVLSLYDIWALPKDTRRRLPCPWVALVPVDGTPVSSAMLERLRTVDYPVAYSKFGLRELEKVGVEASYVPHAIDTELFTWKDNKQEAREHLGIPPDVFLVTTVAANKGYPPRKSWPELLAAFARFRENHLDALLYCHTSKKPRGGGGAGIYFDQLMRELEIPKNSIAFPDQGALAVGVPDSEIVAIYQASDVMLLPSRAEGFGLPVVESEACGCPVIVQNCSAMPELVVNGIVIEPLQKQWLSQLGYNWWIPSVERIVDALEEVYGWDDELRRLGREKGIAFVKSEYDWDVVWNRYWIPFITELEQTLW